MFEHDPSPRLFGLPLGVDFADAFVAGLLARCETMPPEALARAEIYVNTRRMARRIRDVFDAGPSRLLPRIRLITDLAQDPIAANIPPAVAPLRRQLELAQLVDQLQRAEPGIAPEAALFDLSESLAKLLDEMQGEGVDPSTIAALDVSDQSGHWQRSLKFISIVQTYLDMGEQAPDPEARQRKVVEALTAQWATNPPQHPVIIAGSTGSRGTTALLMKAVADLPQGAIVLPGFDFDLPRDVWDQMSLKNGGEDHPQFRFRKLADMLDIHPMEAAVWTKDTPPNAARNRLISLSLRPAPVTDQWRVEGQKLTDIAAATETLTLIEAPSVRVEAEAIALRLRAAIDEGKTAALITPDRMLTRQVSAALDRWEIKPDDSAGQPLPLSPPGRFLRQVAGLFGKALTAETLLALLKHPLALSGQNERGDHLRFTRDLELDLRRNGPPFPDANSLAAFAEKKSGAPDGRREWAVWLGAILPNPKNSHPRALSDHVAQHLALTEALAQGPNGENAGGLWDKAAGREAARQIAKLRLHADAGGEMSYHDYARLLDKVLGAGEVRDPEAGHPQVLILGTLEARVQGADLIILGGLNEGIWPPSPSPDPWLNRSMRAKAGLLLPERRIGLSAHDYQQAVAGREVWLSRSVRSQDAQTVASRWLNRLTNLLSGLPENGGPEALEKMRARGNIWLNRTENLSHVDKVSPAKRPSPRPPSAVRPKKLSVTRITTLIRDPYAIYAQYILGLRQLNPIARSADAPFRGMVLHDILQRFIGEGHDPKAADAKAILIRIADEELHKSCPWPTVHRMWLARLNRFADWFIETEIKRQERGKPDASMLEIKGITALHGIDFEIEGRADRIDLTPEGEAIIYDYKTGAVPSLKEQTAFEKQLLIEAAMVEQHAFSEVPKASVESAVFIGLGGDPKETNAPLDKESPGETWEKLHVLIRAWSNQNRGYTSRWAPKIGGWEGPYDHLSRFGEWTLSDAPEPEDLS